MENTNRQRLTALLNALLEAERAGVKVLSTMIREAQDEALKVMLREFLSDEGMNCQILSTLIRHLGGEPSKKTGDFVSKIEALKSRKEKYELLAKGQEWVVKQIRKNRSLFNPGSLDLFMESIKVQHEENIDSMRKLLEEKDP
jgi:hypothetical protein